MYLSIHNIHEPFSLSPSVWGSVAWKTSRTATLKWSRCVKNQTQHHMFHHNSQKCRGGGGRPWANHILHFIYALKLEAPFKNVMSSLMLTWPKTCVEMELDLRRQKRTNWAKMGLVASVSLSLGQRPHMYLVCPGTCTVPCRRCPASWAAKPGDWGSPLSLLDSGTTPSPSRTETEGRDGDTGLRTDADRQHMVLNSQ